MNMLLRLLALLLLGVATQAHPGVGIVEDGRGNVFFTDLKQVWKISPTGQQSVTVSNVHTHELCIDSENTLYGEHLWADGNEWRHRVWRLKADGSLSDVIPPRSGFLSDYSFVRDRAGNMYLANRGDGTVIKKLSPDGKISIHSAGDFKMVQWLTATPSGTLFLMDAGDLRRVALDGKVSTIARNLSSKEPVPAKVSERNYHMGLWTDPDGSVYVAVGMEHAVLRVRANGTVEVAARSIEPWSPSGGMSDHSGNLWLLEYDTANKVRARCIKADGHEKIFPGDTENRK